MATAIFYSFSKRKNSTKQPTGSGDSYSVTLKSGTSLLSPTLLLNIASRPSYNYLSFEGRYYFVTDIVSVRNNLWEISCTVDALASWKTEIGSTAANILYASGGRSDIVDNRIPVDDSLTIDVENSGITGLTINDTVFGSVILAITGIGSFGCYLMQYPDDIVNLLKNMSVWGNTNMTDETTAIKELVYGGSAGQNLKGAIALPILISASDQGSQEQLFLGRYPCADLGGNAIYGYRIISPIITASGSVDIPWQYNDWRRYNPYTKVYLYLPLLGMISVATNDIVNEASFSVLYSINITSGDISAEVRGGTSGRILVTANGNIAMNIPYGSSNISAAKVTTVVGAGVAAVAGIATGNMAVAGKALSIGGSIAATASSLVGALGGESTGGGGLGGGSSQGLTKVLQCYTVSRTLTETQANLDAVMGKPVMAKHTINTYSGFVQTDGMCVSGNMTDSEHDIINAACDRGIYYE